jgi:hypothetical protein
MSQQMEAELLFDTPQDRDHAVTELERLGYDIEFLDYVDEYEGVVLTDTVWIKVRGTYEGDDHKFFHEMVRFVGQYHGDVCEAGFADPPPVA